MKSLVIERRIQSEVFLRHDIESILEAIDGANAELAAQIPGPDVEIYRAGFTAALRAVATAFHISLRSANLRSEDFVDVWAGPDPSPAIRLYHGRMDRD